MVRSLGLVLAVCACNSGVEGSWRSIGAMKVNSCAFLDPVDPTAYAVEVRGNEAGARAATYRGPDFTTPCTLTLSTDVSPGGRLASEQICTGADVLHVTDALLNLSDSYLYSSVAYSVSGNSCTYDLLLTFERD